jgi:heme-degrading monooxygenase HmoA
VVVTEPISVDSGPMGWRGKIALVIRHVVLFRFNEGTTPEQVDAYEQRLLAYVSTLSGVESYQPARDAGLNPGTYDFSIVAEFADEAAFRAYFDGDEHLAIQRDTAPMFAGKASSQSRVGTGQAM